MAMDLGMVHVDESLLTALDALRGDVWSCVVRDFTSPIMILLGLDPEVMNRGIGAVSNILIPEFILDLLGPLDFSHVVARDWGAM